jgi:hypothetical protein
MGWLTDQTGSYSAGLLAMSGFLLAAALLAASLRLLIRRGSDGAAAGDL